MEHLPNPRFNWPIFPHQMRNESSQGARLGHFGPSNFGNMDNLRSTSYSTTHHIPQQNNFSMRGYGYNYSTIVPAPSYPLMSTEANLNRPYSQYSSLDYSTSASLNTSQMSDENGGKAGGWLFVSAQLPMLLLQCHNTEILGEPFKIDVVSVQDLFQYLVIRDKR